MHALLSVSGIILRAKMLGDSIGIPALNFKHLAEGHDAAMPFLEIDNAYHYVVKERGIELRRDSTHDIDELLYWILRDQAFVLASEYAAQHHKDGGEFRRTMFDRQLVLMGKIAPIWRDRLAAQINEVLARVPFTDDGPAKVA